MTRSRAWSAVAILLLIAVSACEPAPKVTSAPLATQPAAVDATGAPSVETPGATATTPAPVAAPGHELYGFLPYWEMGADGIADHVAGTPLTTLAMFSVTHTAKGALNTNQRGYTTITGDAGRGLIRDAQARGTAVELVYTSFGSARNRKLLESPELQAKVIASLVAAVGDLRIDGINVDIESLDPLLVPAYATFITNLRAAVVAADPADQVSVSTAANSLGAAMAAAAATAGADRIFLMGYDYRTGRSQPGASSPLDRSDGGRQSLRTSLDLYQALGVPPESLLLGLPLYGVEWPVAGPAIGAPSTGRGRAWFPRSHVDLLSDPSIVPLRDEIEQVEVYLSASDGMVGAPSPSAATGASTSAPVAGETPGPTATAAPTWTAVYVDSPATLAPKLALANERGLAGAGFWAIGYDRGLPGYTELMDRFVAGDALP